MASSSSHRASMSISATSAAAPGPSAVGKQRRMTAPSLPPPPNPLGLPEPVYGYRRPPSPLRNGVTVGSGSRGTSEDGTSPSDDSGDANQWGERPTSPTPSVAQFAANFAHRVGSIVSNMSSQRSTNYLPTDEELEAEAEKERERTRREAERILLREAETKRLEQRVLALLEADMAATDLTPPQPLSQGDPSTPPSPSNSQRASWWNAAKNRLTPTKDPLTPAQQIIQEAKSRDKEIEKERKEIEKEKKEIEKEMKKMAKKQEKQKSKDWPSSTENKFEDPAFLQLNTSAVPRSRQSSPSPSPARQHSIPASLAHSPLRSNTDPGSAKQPPPLYAQFNAQGTLDVPGTLLVIASRFEKLERWTVSHVRALEERMDDVERWLVEREQEKEQEKAEKAEKATKQEELPAKILQSQQTGDNNSGLHEIREELAEVQGRIGELGREMARLMAAPANLSSGPSRGNAAIARAPSTSSSIAVRSISMSTPRQATTKDPISPPVVTTPPPPSRTRLPYPTGDYATPPDSTILHQGPFSPPNSPPFLPSSGHRNSISGLPSQSTDLPSTGTSPSGLPRPSSPSQANPPIPASLGLGHPSQRSSSVSPTPRKRYTVALGGPIVAPSRERERPHSRNQSRDSLTVPLSVSPAPVTDDSGASGTDSDSGPNEETIGKAASRINSLNFNKFKNGNGNSNGNINSNGNDYDDSSDTPSQTRRSRPQSMYNGVTTSQNILSPTPTTPLNIRLRSRSTDRFGLNALEETPVTPAATGSGRFVDPLQVRRQTKEAIASSTPAPPKAMTGKPKIPVGQLVAFFDQEKS